MMTHAKSSVGVDPVGGVLNVTPDARDPRVTTAGTPCTPPHPPPTPLTHPTTYPQHSGDRLVIGGDPRWVGVDPVGGVLNVTPDARDPRVTTAGTPCTPLHPPPTPPPTPPNPHNTVVIGGDRW